MVHLLRYIRDKNNLGLEYYANIDDVPLSDLLRQAIIKTDNQLMVFSDSNRKDCPNTDIITGECIVLYQGGTIDHFTHVLGTVSKSSADSEYNSACIAGMALEHLRILNNELLDKDKYVVP